MPRTTARLADRAQYALLRLLARLPASLQLRLSGEPPVVIDGQTLDPFVQLLRALRRRRGAPGLVEPTYAAGRARFRRELLAFAGPKTPVGAVRDFAIPGPGGELRVRHYAPPAPAGGPTPSGAAPLLVYFHGGGFVIGDVESYDEPCRILCRHAGTHVLSVDYRLAPEHPFPAGLEDARAALRWAQKNAAALGADPTRVAVGGDSAGANLATVAAQLAADEGEPAPFAQLLVYPPTDGRTQWPSEDLFGEGFFLSNRDRAAFSGHYLSGTGVRGDDPRVSPLQAPDLSGLPPALVVTAAFDLLRDEGEAYAAALQAAGSPARALRVAGLGHGFVNITGISPAARRAMIDVAREWRATVTGAQRGMTAAVPHSLGTGSRDS